MKDSSLFKTPTDSKVLLASLEDMESQRALKDSMKLHDSLKLACQVGQH